MRRQNTVLALAIIAALRKLHGAILRPLQVLRYVKISARDRSDGCRNACTITFSAKVLTSIQRVGQDAVCARSLRTIHSRRNGFQGRELCTQTALANAQMAHRRPQQRPVGCMLQRPGQKLEKVILREWCTTIWSGEVRRSIAYRLQRSNNT